MTVTVEEDTFGIKRHKKDGLYHCEDGPAIDYEEFSDQDNKKMDEFWLNGVSYSFEDWLAKVEHSFEHCEATMLHMMYSGVR